MAWRNLAGYISLKKEIYGENLAHILIWKYFLGRNIPDGWLIDHINGKKWDNSEKNLRCVPPKVNNVNVNNAYSDNKDRNLLDYGNDKWAFFIGFNGSPIRSLGVRKKKALRIRKKVNKVMKKFSYLSQDKIVDDNVMNKYELKLRSIIEKGKKKRSGDGVVRGGIYITKQSKFYTMRASIQKKILVGLNFPITKPGVNMAVSMLKDVTDIINDNHLEKKRCKKMMKTQKIYENKRKEIMLSHRKNSVGKKEVTKIYEWAKKKYPEVPISIYKYN